MKQETIDKLKATVRNIPDFPIKGIQFKDLTTTLKDGEALAIIADELEALYAGKGVTKVVGIESRGFIGGAILAARLGAGFVPVRKPGKLPDTIEVHKDAITPNDVVVLHDDLLATGGTMKAALDLINEMHPKKVYVNFICELSFLHGRNVFPEDVEVTSLFDF